MGNKGILTLFILIFDILKSDCLRLNSLIIPRAVHTGESFWINCSYDLQDDQLYSIKWFKDDVEFYRFLPKDEPNVQLYEVPGVNLDLNKSHFGNVYISVSNLDTEGNYQCEVSAEAPSFQTIAKQKALKVYYLPKKNEELIIDGIKPSYDINDLVEAKCSTGISKPRAYLTWYINGNKAPLKYLQQQKSWDDKSKQSYGNDSLGLRFFPKMHHFPNGVMRLRCDTIIKLQYTSSIKALLLSDKQQPTTFRLVDEKDLGNYIGSINIKEDLIMDGFMPIYNKDDQLNLSCKFTNFKINSDSINLKWFINEQEVNNEMINKLSSYELNLNIHLDSTFLELWTVNTGKSRMQLVVKCEAVTEEILFQASKEKIMRRYMPSAQMQSTSVNNADSVAMDSNGCSHKTNFIIFLWFIVFALMFKFEDT